MDDMREDGFLGLSGHGFHRVAYVEWGMRDAPRTVICVHGLTRNGRDFDVLARSLSDTHRVVCPDVAGRGRSEWLAVSDEYAYPTYCADMAALIARLRVEQVDWVGTSMGGLMGMMLAAQPGSPVRRLVLNDIGPFIPQAALERIGTYLGLDLGFDSVDEVDAYLREVHAPFGSLSDEQWRHLAEHGHRVRGEGVLGLAYDPRIAEPFRANPPEDVDLWALWDAVQCPVLVLRGAESDLLLPEVAEQMRTRGPGAEVVEFSGAGHAPALMAPEQVRVVADWLSAD